MDADYKGLNAKTRRVIYKDPKKKIKWALPICFNLCDFVLKVLSA